MLRTTIPAAIALACLAVVETAHAQTAVSGLGNKGQFILSADRLFGLNVWQTKSQADPTPLDMNPGVTKDSGTSIGLLWATDTSAVNGENVPVYSAPRLGFDYLVIPGLTVGGALGYVHRSASRETTNANNVSISRDLPSGNAFLLYPRVGYIFDFTPLLSVWARGGFTYYWLKSEVTTTNMAGTVSTTTKLSADGLALTLDPQLVITPIPHVGFCVGPMLDLPLSGGSKLETTAGTVSTTATGSAKVTNWGISAGLLAYF
jgi:hypothetical protein